MQTKINPLRQNRLASLLMEASPAANLLTDRQGTIEFINHTTQQYFGYQNAELVGRPMDVLFPGISTSDDTSHAPCIFARLNESNPTQTLNLQAHRKDGSTFRSEVTFNRLNTVAGDAYLANVINLSDEVPHDDELIQGERLAAVLQMVSGLAHESRNALQRAQSCLDLLQLDLADQTDLMTLTDQIRQALQDIHRNYEEVKNYAAPITLKRTTVDLETVCQTTFRALTSSLSGNPPQLSTHCSDECRSVKLDAARIGEVFRHVLENAIHASEPGGLIEFQCDRPSSNPGSDIQIRVRDHGEGLTAEAESRMFEPFFTTKTRGTGLGLALCRRIIEAHGGTIEASNDESGGTVVKINVPTQDRSLGRSSRVTSDRPSTTPQNHRHHAGSD